MYIFVYYPMFGCDLDGMREIKLNCGRCRYGDCFRTNIFGTTNVFFSSTGAAKIILNNEGENFTKRYIKSVGEIVGDNSVLCASTQRHKLIRSRLANLFSLSSLSIFTKQFDQLVLENLSDWEHKAATVVVLREALKVILFFYNYLYYYKYVR